jgi:tetratricopeptide (TPR) repeat protein
VTSDGSDGGIDVIAEKTNPIKKKEVIQVKRYDESNPVGRPDIQQYASLRQEETDVDTVVVVTSSRFTDGAEEVASKLNVKLVNGFRLYNLIEALSAFDLALSYVSKGPSSRSITEKAQISGEKNSLEYENERQSSSSGGQEDHYISISEIPTTIPSIVDTRKYIMDKIELIKNPISNANEHRRKGNYVESVKEYRRVVSKQREIQQSIAQYDAGLTRIDSVTAENFPDAKYFFNKLTELTEGIETNLQDTYYIAQRVKGIEQLAREIETYIQDAENNLSAGKSLLDAGDIEKAYSKFQKAQNLIPAAQDTFELYESLCSEYDTEVVESHEKISLERPITTVKKDIDSALQSHNEFLDIAKIADEAHGSFEPNLLIDTNGLYDRDLIDYITDNESLEFVFDPPRRGFKIIDEDENVNIPYVDSGSCFLLITDERVLLVAGIKGQDETYEAKYEKITGVNATLEGATPSIEYSTKHDAQYKIEGLHTKQADINSAADYVEQKLNKQ